jgi:Lon protease-like protein
MWTIDLNAQTRISELTERTEVALFPIPDVVSFPGTTLPLHVFEPRYRKLVQDCVADSRLLGVCHTRKTIREAPDNQTVEEVLQSNQATYQPHEVFTAGLCRILETVDDGRMLVAVDMQHRFVIREEQQTLPYRIVLCDLLEDEAQTGVEEDNEILKARVAAQIVKLVDSQKPQMTPLLVDEWAALTPTEFSFKLFDNLKFDPDRMQDILELRSANARLQEVWQILK